MKKILKVLKFSLATLVGLLAVLMAIVYGVSSSRIAKTFPVKDTVVPVFTTQVELTEGKRLFFSRGCADCHGDNHAGKTFIDDPAIGKFTGSNLTSGKGGVLAGLTDFDIERAIRHGVGQRGRPLLVMPSTDFQGMSNQDVGKIISYIRSVPPVDNTPPALRAGPLGRFLYLIGQLPIFISAEKINHDQTPISVVIPGINMEFGKYVAQTCTGCHRDNFTGGPIQGAPPEWPAAANITAKALAKWSEADFIAALRTGKRPDGSNMNPIMPWKNLSKMTDIEIKALWQYLQKL